VTEETFAEIMAILEVVARTQFGRHEQQVWWWLIGDLPDDPAREAVIRLGRTSPYPPKPADIVNAVRGNPRDIERLLDEEAELALAHFEANVCDYAELDFGPRINAVVRAIGGLDQICLWMVRDEWKFHRDEFRRSYRGIRRRGDVGEAGAPLRPLAVEQSAKFPAAWYEDRGLAPPAVQSIPFQPQESPSLPTPTAPSVGVLR
jgi:hypothetical protein